MDDNCGEYVESMGVASGSGWNMGVVSRRWMWVESMGVVVRGIYNYIDFLILLIPTPLYLFILKMFLFLFQYFFVIKFYVHVLNNFFTV